MQIFISWSGLRSRKVAELLKDWVQGVIQAVEPWISSQNIDRGAIWFTEIINQLSTVNQAIICLTKDNKDNPWILFEAGGFAKGLSTTRVYTFLIDLQSSDIATPLSQFNHTLPTQESMLSLIKTINNSLPTPLPDNIITRAFNLNWPSFETSFNEILLATADVEQVVPKRKSEDILLEVLDTIRSVDKRMIENRPINLHSLSRKKKMQFFTPEIEMFMDMYMAQKNFPYPISYVQPEFIEELMAEAFTFSPVLAQNDRTQIMNKMIAYATQFAISQ